jgi:hypothetical protein
MFAKFKSKTHLLNIYFDFWCRFLCVWLQSFKKILIGPKKICWKKIKNGIKNAEFHADFKFVEKVLNKCTKKSYKQNKFEEHV